MNPCDIPYMSYIQYFLQNFMGMGSLFGSTLGIILSKVGRSLVDPAFGGSNKIPLQLVRLQGRCAGETRCRLVEPPAEHTMTRAFMPKP